MPTLAAQGTGNQDGFPGPYRETGPFLLLTGAHGNIRNGNLHMHLQRS